MGPTSLSNPPKRERSSLRSGASISSTKRLSDLLTSFAATSSPSSVSQLQRTATGRPRRGSAMTSSYVVSPDTRGSGGSDCSDRSFAMQPPSVTEIVQTGEEDESDDDEDEDSIIVAHGSQRKRSPSSPKGRHLPSRSTRSRVSYAPEVRKIKKRTSKAKSVLRKQPVDSSRVQIRRQILENTKPRRDAFLLAHKELFLPLLPRQNYISKLENTHHVTERSTIPYQSLTEQPHGIRASMKPYQLEGLSFLVFMKENGMSSILGDEMGLGKTLQTLSLFQYLAANDPVVGPEVRPHLVVCPLSVLQSWINEAHKWVPDMHVVRFHGSKVARDRLKTEMLCTLQRDGPVTRKDKVKAAPKIDLVVTTYETFISEANWFKRAFAWRYCVLDEGHKIKNDASEISRSIQSLQAEYRLLLTGTPLQNNLLEMWSLLHWLYPEVFCKETGDSFQKAFDLSHGRVSTDFMDCSRRLLEVIMLRRMKSSPGVKLGLPPKTEVLLYVPLTPVQRFWYTRMITKMDTLMFDELFQDARQKVIKFEQEDDLDDATLSAQIIRGDTENDAWAETRNVMVQTLDVERSGKRTNEWTKLMNLIMQLRKVCSHPYLISAAIPDPYYVGDHIIKSSGKFIVLEKLVQELVIQQGKKVLIFSGFTSTLDLCEDLLSLKGGNNHDPTFKFLRFDGSTGRARRNLAIRMFNERDSPYRVMLISTRAGGLGINLPTASDVIFLDEDWNPQVTLQAEGRAHRIGQINPVTVFKLCTQGTVEEQMMGRIRKKLYLSTKITGAMRNMYDTATNPLKRKRSSMADVTHDAPQLEVSELKSLIRKGMHSLTRPELDVTAMLDWDFDTMIEQCKDKADDPSIAAQQGDVAEEDEHQWLNTMEKVEGTMFESKKHHRKLEETAKEPLDLPRADRRLGKNTTVMIDGYAISKESLNCGDWEAVPTMAGKDPRLAEPVRAKKAKVVNQDYCQHCWDGGKVVCCSSCPRAYHTNCLEGDFLTRNRGIGSTFYCPQHECLECGGKTSAVGGMVYRCRWCPGAYCDGCLDWDNINLIGDTIPELVMIGYTAHPGGFYIECSACVKHWRTNEADRKAIRKEELRIKADFEAFLAATGGSAGSHLTSPSGSEAPTPVANHAPTMLFDSKRVKLH